MQPRTDSPTITPPLGQLKPVDPTPSALQLKPVPGLTGGNQSALLKSNLPIAQASEGQVGGGIASVAPSRPKVNRFDTRACFCQRPFRTASCQSRLAQSKLAMQQVAWLLLVEP